MEIKKTKTMIGQLVDIGPPESKATRFMRLKGRTGSVQYSDRLSFSPLSEGGQYESGFITSKLTKEPKRENGIIAFETQNSVYRFREVF
jgi:hypothetical protein